MRSRKPISILAVILAAAAALTLAPARPAHTAPQAGAAAAALTPADGLSAAAAAWVAKTMAGLTLEKKIAQLVTADVAGGYIADDDPRLAGWTALARDHGLGMFVFYGGTPRDVARLLNRLQKAAAVPLLISADFEGGPGQQVTGASEFPANMAFAAAGDEDLMYRAASAAAVEGRAMGVHLTYTPVCDIAWNPDNPAESVRSFGGDLDRLGRLVRAYVRGYHEHGMLTSAKHFPGRGDVANMPGNPPWAWNPKPAADIESQEFAAFKLGIEAGVDFVMTEHIAVPSVTDGSRLPASVEPKLVAGWLKGRLGFKGLVTSDDLWYDHVAARFGAEEVAVKAFEAGHDIILKPKDPVAAIGALAAAVRSGRIPEARVDEAVRKLLTLKARLGLHLDRFVDEARVGEFVGTAAHQALVREVADRSLTMLKNDGVLPLGAGAGRGAAGRPAGPSRIVNIAVQKVDGDTGPAALAAKLAAAFPGTPSFALRPDMDPAYYETVWKAVGEADRVVLSLFVARSRMGDAAPFRDGDLAFLKKVIAAKPKAVVAMSYGNPQLIRKIPDVGAFLVGYGERGWFGNQSVYFDSFIQALKGGLQPSGRLPVRVSDRYPIGAGLSGR
ncbi:MAG TPA: glycoside hydrolase family 3 N-terminal domain-containing protein [Candidatus Aminicenantes bacterium]|nr:glycoside hydrolase family 3 N-terminal domain-containing protein [Candidatus Aminicenantes bacterium]HRY65585.1 glycoside hydrolase family 3 N-terminal domain-containing protein [Candidatus Aminicenantes bacterium]HRZ72527.1 glycoside hydrolase family 3 N-terminal domain-containing protein [Candidatus Aminicenantes bacterium]